MEQIYFISDVHLGADTEEKEKIKKERLLNFLTSIYQKADFLYIVGDLFDFWFEYRHTVPKISLKLMSKLNLLVETGTEVRYLVGNHDLWLGDFLQKEINVKIYHDPLAVTHNTLNLYIAHGDGFAKSDVGSRVLKRIFKNRVNIFLFSLLHPDFGIPFARLLSRKSKEKGENRFEEDYRNFAISKIDQGFDAIILGHIHRPFIEKINSKFYINLGDWIRNFTYLELSGKEFQLKSWVSKNDQPLVRLKLNRTSKV
jgi:UDP-2,3-diacylglucosamine hydrolase